MQAGPGSEYVRFSSCSVRVQLNKPITYIIGQQISIHNYMKYKLYNNYVETGKADTNT